MAYSSDIARLLAEQLAKFATLNRHQLAGQLSNLDFWAAEFLHCRRVIEGYGRRFERMKAAQMKHVADHGTEEFDLDDPCCTRTTAAPPRRTPSQEFDMARRQLGDAFYRFMIRGFVEGLLDEGSLRRVCAELDIGVDSRDLRRRT